MKAIKTLVIYWDSSAVLSALIQDSHSEQAVKYAGLNVIHLISSLAVAEVQAVLNRIKREQLVDDPLIEAASKSLKSGPWRYLKMSPTTSIIKKLAPKWPLRGADLWHLAAAKTLQTELPELLILTFDQKLYLAASGEALAFNSPVSG